MSRAEIVSCLVLAAVLSCAPSESGALSGTGATAQETGEERTPAESRQPRVVTPGGDVILLEVARTDLQRARGLMFRESLPENHGMLFVFDESDRHGFWMKNTFVSLDMLWLEDDGTIAAIKRGVPPCRSDPCPTYVPDAPGLYVLEIAAGEADRLGLAEGDRLELRNIEPPTRG